MKKSAWYGGFMCALLLAWGTHALALTITLNAATNWSAINTGSGALGQPSSADIIILTRGAMLTVNVANGQCASIQLGLDTGPAGQRGSGTLTFNAGSQVTVSGSVTLGDNASGGLQTGILDMSAGGTLISNGFTVNVFGAWTPGSGTVQLQATNTLPTQFNTNGYNNLTVNGGTTSLSGGVTVAGSLNVAAGTLAVGANTLNVSQNFTVNGTLSGTGPVNLTGSGTTIGGTGSVTDTGILTLSTGAKSILSTATLSFAGTVAISGAIAVTNNGSVTSTAAGGITGTVAGSTWTNAANSTLNVSGPLLATGTLTANANPNTVTYAGAAQTVKLPSAGYFHLTLSGSGAKTLAAGTTTIAGNLTLSGVTYDGTTNNPTVNLAGNFTDSGTFNSGSGTFTFNGGSAQTLSGTSANTTFTNLKMNNASGLSISHNVTVSTLLTLTSGVVSTATNTLITSANCPGSISRVSGHIKGNLQLKFATGAQTCTFHLGDAAVANYTPLTVTFTNVGTAGGLVGSVSAGDFSDVNIPLDQTVSVNRSWTLTLPASAPVALAVASTYSTAFTYLASDNDDATQVASYIVAKGDTCAATCATWATPTVSGTPTSTAATAAGMTSFNASVFAVGKAKNLLNNFLITPGTTTPNTCNSDSVTITARNAANVALTGYTGLVSLTTSSIHGDWSVNSANGTLNNGTADDGTATYQFVAADNGSITLNLTNTHADDLTITVNDSTAGVTATSSTIQFRGNVFVITNDTIQVAGRPQAMSVQMNRGSTCAVAVAGYAGAKSLKAWLTLDVSDPGGAAPAIGAVSVPSSVPGANNVTLTFTSGVASFNLSTTDVGKYVLNLRDDNRTFATGADINGSSAIITTRPFALAFTNIKQGALANPGGTSGAGAKFVAAEDTFQATVGAYLWQGADDANNDGVPDSGADVTNNGSTPSFKWATTLSATTPITPVGGSTGTLGGTVSIVSASFSGGAATVADLTYNQVGSVTLSASATNFLNSGITVSGASTPVGRFYPDHFALTASALAAACNGFTYMNQAAINLSYTLQAQGKSNGLTSNYSAALGYPVTAVTLVAENANAGTDLAPRMTSTPAAWAAGQYSVSSPSSTFARLAAPDGPYDALAFGVRVVDADGAVIANRDMNAATAGNCVTATNCDAKQIAGATTKARFGRLRISNANGSQLIAMPLPIQAQYWNGTGFVTNALDNCTNIATANIAIGNPQRGLTAAMVSPPTVGGAFTAGIGTLRLPAPGSANRGSVDVSVNLTGGTAGASCTTTPALPASTGSGLPWLQGAWCGATYTSDPTARATFGVYRNTDKFIYQRENY
jgi:hypothetical protein